MPQVRITLPPGLARQDYRVILKYFEQTGQLTPHEWQRAFTAFDALGEAILTRDQRRLTFRQFYERRIDGQFAGEFIARLETGPRHDLGSHLVIMPAKKLVRAG